ncbi:DUF6526 family protein [Filimonas effusa]|uniref:Uncharacterized protein n=1 Tax=Filimonas effusa TaxID=2508721 RepID=A0A4Q1D4N4_9BACT|nr:DUF6526 family protein [Filimonas effusa]RXK83410.1 hypothetical protein ESB13_15045 [Filimonas effusa]
MKTQNYKNHVRYYPPHHFMFYPIVLAMLIISIRNIMRNTANTNEWIMLTALVIMLTWLAFMTRQHYALMLQNRLVRLEMSFRYYVLTQSRLELLQPQLTFGQLAALRFASDEELPALVQRTLREQLTPDLIKQAIKNWRPDHMRV